jgi:hypothetical protein
MDETLEIAFSSLHLQPPRKATSFLDLPTEIRVQIYSAYFQHERPYKLPLIGPRYDCLDRSIENKNLSLLLVCKQIYREAVDILYEESSFQLNISDGGVEYLQPHERCFNEKSLSLVRSLQLVAPFRRGLRWTKLDTELWGPFLSQLTHITMVIDMPHQYLFTDAEDFNQDMDDLEEWLRWTEQIVKVLADNVSKNCRVEIDCEDDGIKTEFMGHYLKVGYHEVRTEAGDLMYTKVRCGVWVL